MWWTGDSFSGARQKIEFPRGSFWAEGHLGQYAVDVPALDLIIVNQLDGKITRRVIQKREMALLVRMIVGAAPHT